MSLEILRKAREVATFSTALDIIPQHRERLTSPVSQNLGAIFFDAIFQAGLNYKTVVYPRVQAIENTFSDCNSVSKVVDLVLSVEFAETIKWNHAEKPRRLEALVFYLSKQGMESIEDVQSWCSSYENLVSLQQIKGVGVKTADYLSRLLGCETIVVDRHAFNFLNLAGVKAKGYLEAKFILQYSADLLGIPRCQFDRIVWLLMSQRTQIAKMEANISRNSTPSFL